MIQLLKNTLHLLRHNKLVWIFGIISMLYSSLPSPSEVSQDLTINWLYTFFLLIASVVSIIARSCSVYTVYQITQEKSTNFSEAWTRGKSLFFRIFGLLILYIVMPLLAGVCSATISAIIPNKAAAQPMLWILDLLANVFYSPLLIFGICAVIINDLKVWAAAWTGFLITLNNFFRVLLVIIAFALIKSLVFGLLSVLITGGIITIDSALPSFINFDFVAYRNLLSIPIFRIASIIISIIFVPVMNTFLTLGYLKFITEIDYPSLSIRKPPNTGST